MLMLAPRLLFAFVFRYLCFMAMVWLALWAEARPAPTLPDLVLERVPYVAWVDRYNYLLWVAAYLPAAVALLVIDARRFIRYMVVSGIMSVVRGLCIVATGLGPVRGGDPNAGLELQTRLQAFFGIINPVSALWGDAPHVYLTKDLFFSGHTSTTLLLLLYVWRVRWLRGWMLAGHLAVVASIFFSHLHYTIDVVGGWAVAFSIFVLAEGDLRALLGLRPEVSVQRDPA